MTSLCTADRDFTESDVSVFKVYIQQEMTRYSKNVYLFSLVWSMQLC